MLLDLTCGHPKFGQFLLPVSGVTLLGIGQLEEHFPVFAGRL